MVSTVLDYMRFAQMLLNESQLDGTRVLKAETVREMLKRISHRADADRRT
ncbi:MAG: hypothetical protein JNM81_08775 [Rhodospirillaceae bacterium]|nr:hypothetical protein [Rhodospirillaceae bacterium]